MSDMKIVVISHAMIQPPLRARWRQLAERYSVDVTLLVPEEWTNPRPGRYPLLTCHPVDERRFHVMPVPVTHTSEGTSYWIRSVDANLRAIKPDIIHVVQESSALVLQQMILYRALWARRAKLTFFSYENIAVPARSKRWKTVRTFTDMAIAGNHEVEQVLRRSGYRRPVVVQTEIGVDESQFFPDETVRTTKNAALGLHGMVIGFAGRLSPNKGLYDLFQALQLLRGEWSLLVVGDGELRHELQEWAEANEWNAVFTGYASLIDMPDHFRMMDCLVLPSRTGVDWKEQFGLVLAQAMCCRVPVIGSSSGAIPEVIGDAGMVFPEGDISALCACLQLLVNDVSLRSHFAEIGYRRSIDQYSATSLADSTYQLFCNLLAR